MFRKILELLKTFWQVLETSITSAIKVLVYFRMDVARLFILVVLFTLVDSGYDLFFAIFSTVFYLSIKVYNIYTFNLRNEVPVPRKKFVKENELGALQIDDGDIFEMLQYMNTLQQYFENNGEIKDE